MPRFTLKMNILTCISSKTPQMCVETLITGTRFSEMIDLRGHMPMFTLKMNVFPFISLETHEYVFRPSEQCSFFQDNRFEGSHA